MQEEPTEHDRQEESSAEETSGNSNNHRTNSHDAGTSSGDVGQNGAVAERRAIHNSVERTRREALNAKFTMLAQTIPTLQHVHRPSKSTIISHCIDMAQELREVKYENLRLRQELESVGAMRFMNGHNGMSRHSSLSRASTSLSPPILHAGNNAASMRLPTGRKGHHVGHASLGGDEFNTETNTHSGLNPYRRAPPVPAGLSLYGTTSQHATSASASMDDFHGRTGFVSLPTQAPGLLRLPLGSAVVNRESSREEGVDLDPTPVARHAPRLSFAGYTVTGETSTSTTKNNTTTTATSYQPAQELTGGVQETQQHVQYQHEGQDGQVSPLSSPHTVAGEQTHLVHASHANGHHAHHGDHYPEMLDEPMSDFGRHGHEQPLYHSHYATHSLGEYQ